MDPMEQIELVSRRRVGALQRSKIRFTDVYHSICTITVISRSNIRKIYFSFKNKKKKKKETETVLASRRKTVNLQIEIAREKYCITLYNY